jgi:tetratricopeptide (TPR) repeat protein
MRKVSIFFLLVAPLATSCASLRARLIAQQGIELYRKQEYAAAAAKFAEAEKFDSRIPAIELNLGFANLSWYRAAPKSTEGEQAAQNAIGAFQRYLQLRPNDERAKVFLVQTFVDTGKYEDAVGFFKSAVERDPPDPDALNTLGIIAAKTGRFEESMGWYEKRIAAQPENADARYSLGVLLWDWLHNHPEETGEKRMQLSKLGIEHLAQAIRISPNNPNPYVYTNLLYREKAVGETSEDEKRVDFEEANKFYKLGLELTKSGAAPKGAN